MTDRFKELIPRLKSRWDSMISNGTFPGEQQTILDALTIASEGEARARFVESTDSQIKDDLIESLEAENAALRPRPVVAAVIRSAVTGNYIIGQRKPDQWMAGKWCFVGGKVEPGESLEEAVRREVNEELGIAVTVGRLIHEQIERHDHGTFALHYFECESDFNQIVQLLEVQNAASVPAERLPEYDLLPVDIDIARRLAVAAELAALRANAESWHADFARQAEAIGELHVKLATLRAVLAKIMASTDDYLVEEAIADADASDNPIVKAASDYVKQFNELAALRKKVEFGDRMAEFLSEIDFLDNEAEAEQLLAEWRK